MPKLDFESVDASIKAEVFLLFAAAAEPICSLWKLLRKVSSSRAFFWVKSSLSFLKLSSSSSSSLSSGLAGRGLGGAG
ncbi:hypothetical protein BpHYR1_037975 [Brachionus plicatilis]|uniref:Uncharacterized protein n=1 Tax=Brachionus plicatilis TaxID=10195 RepID=A0A3M7QNB0_BRAPC|nr:hypothetical protein BpHYR1_037975 [Brachionus plicatilis]